MKTRGLDLGYYFNFFLYGPYSTDLIRSGFNITNYDRMNKRAFADDELEYKFKEFIEEIRDKKNDFNWMVCSASILFLKNEGFSKDSILKIASEKTKLKKSYIDSVYNDLLNKKWL